MLVLRPLPSHGKVQPSLQWECARETLGAGSSCSEECAEDSHAEYRRRNNNHVRELKSKKFRKGK